MTPTEKHRETARGIARTYKGMAIDNLKGVIETALANAKREGMKRAAEIVRKLIPHMPPDGPINLEHQAEYEALGFAMQAILSEAGEA